MSRAGNLLRRLEHVNQIDVSEQTPQDSMPSDDDDNALQHHSGTNDWMRREKKKSDTDGDRTNTSDNYGNDTSNDDDDQNIDPQMTNPDSPFSRVTHNPDGSLKVDQNDQRMNDRGRFIVRRRR